MRFFNTPKTLQQLRTEYKNLVFKLHPDVSGYDSTEDMKELNREYDLLSEQLAKGTKFYESEMNFASEFKEKIEVLIKFDNIKIEIIGNWLWITGKTKAIKEELKKMEFKFSGKKRAWFYKSYKYVKFRKKELSLEEIREYYGSKTVRREGKEKSNNKQKEVLA
jgi:curved DNA-binding protein CbpA